MSREAKVQRLAAAYGAKMVTPLLAILMIGVEVAWVVFLALMLMRLIR